MFDQWPNVMVDQVCLAQFCGVFSQEVMTSGRLQNDRHEQLENIYEKLCPQSAIFGEPAPS